MPSPARSLPTTACPVSSPLTRAPASATSPLTVPAPAPHPPPPRLPEPSRRRLRHHRHHSELVGACRPSSLPPPRAPIKGTVRAPPSPHQPRLPPLSFPSPIEPAPPRPPFAPVSFVLPSLVVFGQIALALKVRHSVMILAHTGSSPIAPGDLAGDFTSASARHPPWIGHPRPPPVKLTPPP
jgi:hypothetical protein